ncbi:MAG: hypothetical protein JKY37_08425 [Nannocystaceae bacterium]|nr:hypothetical protein [Nannocystaceae bacterium]
MSTGLDCELDCEGDACPRSVAQWRVLFDARWTDTDESYCSGLATSGGDQQEHYYLGYCVDGLASMWRATGDTTYLDEALALVDSTVEDAVLADDGFRRWPVEFPLWESFYWRHVITMLRVMGQDEVLMANPTYQEAYTRLVQFSEQDIWQKWEQAGDGNLYRSRTHMASHWARLGMELFLITGEQHYRDVFENISQGEMPGRPSNLRDQLRWSDAVPEAFVWSAEWGNEPADGLQDTSHAGAIISFVENAAANEMYWDEADIDAYRATLTRLIWPEGREDDAFYEYVDGVGEFSLPGRLHEWLVLGRHSLAIQKRIENNYVGQNLTFFGIQPLGIAALNARILLE